MKFVMESRMDAFVTHVQVDGTNMLRVWAQVDTDTSKEIERELTMWDNNFKNGVNKVSAIALISGELYCARFEVDDKWYRVRVLDGSQSIRGRVKALFIDHGNEALVSVQDIRIMHPKLAKYPPQAQNFLLANVVIVSPKMCDALVKYCEENIRYDEVRIHVVGHMQGVPVVNIFRENDHGSPSFNMELVQAGFARATGQAVIPPLIMPPPKNMYVMEKPDFSSEGEMFVVHVESAMEFWIQSCLSRDKFCWNSMMVSLEAKILGLQPGMGRITHMGVNQPCVARNEAKGCFARAVISSVEGRMACRVMFVDFGNVELKTMEDVFVVPDVACMSPPCMAHRATLAIESCPVEDEKIILDLKGCSDPVRISVEVIRSDCDGKIHLKLLSGQRPFSSLSTSSCTPVEYKQIELKPGDSQVVTLCHITSATEFYVRLETSKTMYDLMCSEIQHLSTCIPLVPLSKFSEGTPCYVKSLESSYIYRGVIKFSATVSIVSVYFVDIGKVEQVTPACVFRIQPEFLMKMPAQAIKCQLNGLTVQQGRAPHITTEFVSFEGTRLWLTVVGRDPKAESHVVDLVTFSQPPVSINEHIVYLSETRRQNAVVPSPKLNRVESLFITEFGSMHSFFGQLEKVPTEELDDLQKALNDHYGPLTSSDLNLRVEGDLMGAFCCARYTGDGRFYRGRILSQSANFVKILFIDYGNCETKPLCDVKRLLPQFADFAQVGITCHIIDQMKVAAPSGVIGKAITGQSVSVEIFDHDEKLGYAIKFRASEANPELTRKLISYGLIATQSPPMLEYSCLTLGEEENVLITCFTSPLSFWIQLTQNEPTLKTITDMVMHYMSSKEGHINLISSPKDGMACLARFPDDEIWYRSKVNSVFTKTEIEVLFVDYGNLCRVPLSELRAIPEELMAIPSQAIQCCFADIRPVELSRQKLQSLEVELLNNPFYVRVLSHEFPIKLKFIADIDNEILRGAGVLKTPQPPVRDHMPHVPQSNGGLVNGDFVEECWDDAPSLQFRDVPAQRAASSGSNPCPGRKGEHSFEDSGSENQRSCYRPREPRYTNGNPTEGPRRSRWDPAPDEWGCESKKGPSPSHFSDDRRGENRNYVPRFVPPRMQRQFQQDGGRGGSGFAANHFHHRDSRAGDFPVDNAASGAPTFVDSPKPEIPPQPDLAGQFKLVTVVHVEGPGELHCQLAEEKVALKELLSKLNSHYAGLRYGEGGLAETSVGVVCCAQFFADMAWYRARVVRLSGPDVVVNFIDYGNEASVKKAQLKALLPEFLGMPPQAVKCCLEGVKPTSTTWSTEASELLKDAVMYKTMLCQFYPKNGDAYPVKLIDQDQMNYSTVGYYLLAHDEALPINPRSFLFKEIAAGRVQSEFPVPHMEIGSVETVTVVWFNDPHQFFCQLHKNTGQIEDLLRRLSATYSNNRNGELTFQALPPPNTPCVALLCNVWYRAVTLVVTSKDVVVYFVDYGNVEVVSTHEIKVIKPEFMDTPAQAYKCNLRGIRPFGKYWPKMDVTKFQKYFEGSLVCTFCGKYSGGFEVDMVLKGKNVAQAMIADKLACVDAIAMVPTVPLISRGSLEGLVGAPEFLPASVRRAENVVDAGQVDVPIWRKFNHVFNERVEVLFSYINSPDDFYVQNAVEESKINTLLDTLSSEYSESAPEDISDLVPGSLCVAQYSEDDAWYRALVINILDEGLCVKFIDFGNIEVVHPDKMRKISPKFVDLPQFAAHCELHGFRVSDDGPSPLEVFKAFNDLIQEGEKRVNAEFKRLVNGKFSVALFDEDKDLTLELLAGLGLPCPDVPFAFTCQNLAAGDSINIYVSHIVSPSEFWVQRVCDEDGITQLQDELNAHCNDCLEPGGAVSIGAPCLAQFSEDENWYRAIVLEISGQGITVQFVDYGNCEVVQSGKIQKITDHFCGVPQFAVKCTLNGLEKYPPEVRMSQTTVDAFSEATGDGGIVLLANVLGQHGDAVLVQLFNDNSDVADALIMTFSERCPAPVEAMKDPLGITENQQEIACNEPDTTYFEAEFADNKSEAAYCQPQITCSEPEDPYYLAETAYNEPEIPFDAKTEVILSSIFSPSCFWIQLDSRSIELTEMSARLDEAYKDSPADESFEVRKGAPCIAQYSADESWYRAGVLETLPSGLVSVLFMDYGNVEVVSIDKVRRLTEEFQATPVFAHRCRLTRLKAPATGDWSEDVSETFKELVNYGEVVCLAEILKKENGVLVVRLLNMGLDVTEQLVETGKVEASASPVQFEDEPTPETDPTKDLQEDGSENVLEAAQPEPITPDQQHIPGEIVRSCDIEVDLYFTPLDTAPDIGVGESQDNTGSSLGVDKDPLENEVEDKSHCTEGSQCIEDDFHVEDDANVEIHVKVERDAQIEEYAQFKEDAQVEVDAQAEEDAKVEECDYVVEDAWVAEDAQVDDDSQVEDAKVEECDYVVEDAWVAEDAQIDDDSQFEEDAQVEEDAKVDECDYVVEDAWVAEDAQVNDGAQDMEDSQVEGELQVAEHSDVEEDSQVSTESANTFEYNQPEIPEVDQKLQNAMAVLECDTLPSEPSVHFECEESVEDRKSLTDSVENDVKEKSDVALSTSAAGEPSSGACARAIQTSAEALRYVDQDSGMDEIFDESRSEMEDKKDHQSDTFASPEAGPFELEDPVIGMENICLSEEMPDVETSDSMACNVTTDGEFWMDQTPEDLALTVSSDEAFEPVTETGHEAELQANLLDCIENEVLLDAENVADSERSCPVLMLAPLAETEECNDPDLDSSSEERELATTDQLQSLHGDPEAGTSETFLESESFLHSEDPEDALTRVPKQSSPNCDNCDLNDFLPGPAGESPEWPHSKMELYSPIQEHAIKEDVDVATKESTATEPEGGTPPVQFSQEVLQSRDRDMLVEDCAASSAGAEPERDLEVQAPLRME